MYIRDDFVTYAEFCFWEFGDRVKNWITLNEPHSYVVYGYVYGYHAPGRGGNYQIASALMAGDNVGNNQPRGLTRTFTNNVGNPATEPYIVAHNLLLVHAAVAQLYYKGFKVLLIKCHL